MISEQAAYAGGESWLNQCVDYINANQDYANHYIRANIPMIVGALPWQTCEVQGGVRSRRPPRQ